MTMNIKYRTLKAFLLASEARSFTVAANRLGVTQPSFTAMIQDLENIVGLKLFERTTRSVRLTSAGQEFAARVDRPITDLEEAFRSMSDLSSNRRGTVVLGALPSTALSLVPPALGELTREYPALKFRVVEAHNDQLISMLRTNQVEFVLATMPISAPEFEFIPLVDDRIMIVFPTGHVISRMESVHWPDLIPMSLILLSVGSSARATFDRATADQTSDIGMRYDVTHMTTSLLLVRQGLGLAPLPKLALPSLDLQGLSYRPIADETASRTIGILHRRDRFVSPAAQALYNQLLKVAKVASEWGGTDF